MHYPLRMHVVELEPPVSAEAAALRLFGRPGLAWLDGDAGEHAARPGAAAAPAPTVQEFGAHVGLSFVASDPVAVVENDARHEAPFAFLDRLTFQADEAAAARDAESPASPFAARAVPRFIGYLGYDGSACFARYDACLVLEHASGRAFIAGDDAAACARAQERLRAAPKRPQARVGAVRAADPAAHRRAIARALEHIARGDIYQVNLARAFRASYEGDTLALALAMRAQSPVPLGLYFDAGPRALIGRSMECFLRWQRGARTLCSRPIKGTLARAGFDHDEASALAADPKERAEHAMIIDLMRNDLSRVAELGSVRVPEVMVVEPYAKLSHLVSTVACTTRAGLTVRELLEATFPAGSVTGTPKLRAMQLLAALEPEPRGVYTGAYGHIDREGGVSLAVAIRTATIEAGEARYFAGGGIVEASDVERELAETELKARVFRDAIAALAAGGGDVALSGDSVLR